MRAPYCSYTALFLLGCLSAYADSTPSDPQIIIDTGGDPYSLSTQINVVQPSGADPLTFSFVNDLSGIVDSLTFNTTIASGLSSTDSGLFSCPTAAQNGYFLSCQVNYDMTTGALQYQFSGVNPADGDENFPVDHDNEFGQKEGIPIGGDFSITLAGWTRDNTAPDGVSLYSGLPTFDNSFTVTPEPSLVLLVAAQCLFLVVIAGFVRRKAKRRENPTA